MAYFYIVDLIQDEQGVHPSLPDGVSWVGQPDLESGTYIIKAFGEIQDALMVTPLEGLYCPPYQVGVPYKAGDVLEYEGVLYEVIQPHTSQQDWPPNLLPSLYKEHRPEGAITHWKQPLGAQDAYQVGDKVFHAGKFWISTLNANVWAPGVAGWSEIRALPDECEARDLVREELLGIWAVGGET